MERATLRAVLLYYGVTVAAAAAGALTPALSKLDDRRLIGVGIMLLMWAPALGRLVAARTLDRGWKTSAPLRWPRSAAAWCVVFPLAVEAGIYLAAWGLGLATGLAEWAPRWDGPGRIALNVAVNTVLGIVLGGFGALGEELGWRGYMQPRIEASTGVPMAVVCVGLLWWAWHLPVVLGLGYQESSNPALTQTLFAVSCVADSYIWMWACTRTGSVWPAVWFHTFHNLFSQGFFPSLMSADLVWLGEDGILPLGGHVLAALALWIFTHRRG